MTGHLDGDIISPSEATTVGVIRVERVWQHRHDIELRAQKSRFRVSLPSIGAGALALGAICLFAYGDLGSTLAPGPDQAMASYPVDRDAALGSTKLRDIVDITPLPQKISVTEAHASVRAYAVIPTKRPIAPEPKSTIPDKTRNPALAANPSDVVHFDQCKQGCDTRDPLVVGTGPTVSAVQSTTSPAIASVQRPNEALEIGRAAVNGAGFVLVETAALPFTTLKLGRDAAMAISGMD